MPIDSEAFRRLGCATVGSVSIISAHGPDEFGVVALTVSSFVILSLQPPLAMFAIQNSADSYASMAESKVFGVSLLAADQSDVARRFARKGKEKTTNFPFERGKVLGVPLIQGSLAQVECCTSQVVASGDHAIIVGVIEASHTRDARPLLYFSRDYGSFSSLPALGQ